MQCEGAGDIEVGAQLFTGNGCCDQLVAFDTTVDQHPAAAFRTVVVEPQVLDVVALSVTQTIK